MNRLFLVRHGETEESSRRIVQGWLPGTLSAEGQQQAARLAERLRDTPIDAIVASDLARAFRTAEAIATFHPRARLVSEPSLRERSLGDLQGRTATELAGQSADADQARAEAAGVEPVAEFRRRVYQFFENLQTLDAATVVVVSHGGPLRMLHYLLSDRLAAPRPIGFMHPGALSEFERTDDGGWRPLRLDCRAHLDPGRWSGADLERILDALEQRAANDDGVFRKAAVEEIDAAVQALKEDGTAIPGPLPPGRRMTIVEHASFIDGAGTRKDLSVDDGLLADLDRIERLLRA